MKVAVCVPAAGSPGTLATTAFAASLAEGLGLHDAPARLFCLALHSNGWSPASIGAVDAVAPWLDELPKGRLDARDAAARGIFDSSLPCTDGRAINWQLELALERSFESWAGSEDLLVVADTRSYRLLRIVARICARRRSKMVVISNEALTDLQIEARTRSEYVRSVVSCASAIWVVSENLRRFWIDAGYDGTRILLAPSVVRPSSLRRAVAPRHGHVAAYVGNLAHREIDRLLDVARAVRSRVPDFTLRLYGDASVTARAELQSRIEAVGLAEAVTALPPVPPDRIPEVLDEADVLLLPRAAAAYSDAGFPNKLGEYLATGRPVVVTRVGDIGRYLTDGASALLVDADDMDAFSDAVVRVLATPELGNAIGLAGHRVAEEVLSAEAVASRLLALVDSLPKPAPHTPRAPLSLAERAAVLLPDPAVVRRGLVRFVRTTIGRSDASEGPRSEQ